MKISDTSKGYKESDASPEKGTLRPIRDPGIGRFRDRLKEALAGEALKPFAKRAGISEGSIFSYLSGQTYPALDRLDAICTATGRSASWFIASDQGASAASHDLSEANLRIAIEYADKAIRDTTGADWAPPTLYARLLKLLYAGLTQGLPLAEVRSIAMDAAQAMEQGIGGDDGEPAVARTGKASIG